MIRKAPGDVVDIETDGFDYTKIHCIAASRGKSLKSTASYKTMVSYLSKAKIIVGHNIVRFDIPALEEMLGIKIKAKLVDTLALSWYLEPNRAMHGLEWWGEEFGVPKPKVVDWEGLTVEEYLHRCEEDVKINTKLWERQWKQLLNMYGSPEEAWKLIDYLTFKMQCARNQERLKWKLDVPKAQTLFELLDGKYSELVIALEKAMPKVPNKTTKTKPKRCYKQSGELSAYGVGWFDLLKELGEDEDVTEVTYVSSYEEPNAASDPQLKAWLGQLGWVPCTFKFKRDKKTGELRKIPQVRKKNDDNEPILTKSVERLIEQEPSVALLREIGLIKHRLDVVKGFLENVDENGFIKACIKGFTNTLRFKHKVVTNLPGIDKPYGQDLRGCLTAPEGYELCGSDMAALEDRTKQHYMYPHDPEYVETMLEEGYCPHVDIAVLAKYLTKEQEERHKTGEFIDKEDKATIKAGRKKAKPVNYGGVYGQGPEGLARETGMSLTEATNLNKIYWERNWSVKAVAEEQEVRTFKGTKWLRNPLSGFWYSLRSEKDRFSTLNQGSGVYCFDKWVMKLVAKGLPIIGQFHDEVIALIKKGMRTKCEKAFRNAIVEVNEELKMNRELDIDVQFGDNYADIH